MSKEASFSDLANDIERMLEEKPRTAAERMLAFGADFILAIAFFALGLTSNVVAAKASNTAAFISAVVGLIMLKVWSVARGYEGARDELRNLAHDARFVETIADATADALEKRLRVSKPTDDGSSIGSGESVPTTRAP